MDAITPNLPQFAWQKTQPKRLHGERNVTRIKNKGGVAA